MGKTTGADEINFSTNSTFQKNLDPANVLDNFMTPIAMNIKLSSNSEDGGNVQNLNTDVTRCTRAIKLYLKNPKRVSEDGGYQQCAMKLYLT